MRRRAGPKNALPTDPTHETLAVQAGGEVDAATGALISPLYPSTTYERDPDGGYSTGHAYTRADNPTYAEPEKLLATLEAGLECILFASGMAAASAVFQALVPRDHILAPRTMYYALRQWLNNFAVAWGLEVDFVDTTNRDELQAALRPGQTRLVWLETPANPTWEVTDIEAVAALAHKAGARVVVDSTVATPVLTRPMELGADLVVHSASKYLNGHSDVLAGAIVTACHDGYWARIRAWRRDAGAVPGPFETWLLLRGMRTLFLRVRQSSRSALAIARHLEGHAAVSRVLYPGLSSHPQYELASRQMQGGFGGMLSIRVKGGEAAAMAVAGRARVFKRATSLGGVESLIEHRASIEGPSTPVPENLLRLSVGLEHVDDLISDLDQALAAASTATDDTTSTTRPGAADTTDPREAEIIGVLERTIRPGILDRGGEIRLQAYQAGKVTLECRGSPGAVRPMEAHIRDRLRRQIPMIQEVHFTTPHQGHSDPDTKGQTLADRVQQWLDEAINPAVVAHGGNIQQEGIDRGRVRLRMEGGCQGCGMAEVTLRQGIEPLLKAHFPEIVSVVDATDHAAGTEPYYRTSKS